MLSADTNLNLSLRLLISVNKDVKRRRNECVASTVILKPSGCTQLL